MKYKFVSLLCMLLAVVTLSSCHISRKRTGKAGKVIVVSKDNGLHKGWYKNPNNPHHPRTTNPGHTKQKSKGAAAVKSHTGKGGRGRH